MAQQLTVGTVDPSRPSASGRRNLSAKLTAVIERAGIYYIKLFSSAFQPLAKIHRALLARESFVLSPSLLPAVAVRAGEKSWDDFSSVSKEHLSQNHY